jgi:MFS family permease
MSHSLATVWLLAAFSACVASASPLMLLIGSIIGTRLASTEQLATLPIALMVIGTACGVLPVSRAMSGFGRQRAFILFCLVGVSGCLLAGLALQREDFPLFCASAGLLGVANAATQQVRFAAMETVALERGALAASMVMCAGIVAAFVGPELALAGRHLDAVEFRGSYWLGAGCFVAGICLMLFYRPPAPRFSSHHGEARPLRELLRNRSLVLAVASGAIAFAVMSFVMTATPISMHIHHGHSMEDTKWVIQSHIAAMFLPSLATAWLFHFLRIRGLMIAGLACYSAMIVIGLLDASVLGFWGQLVMLGIGWNFLFIAGTALLPTTYREGEQFRAQALNDSVVFGTQAIASLSAGVVISAIHWQSLLLLCLLPMAVMTAALLWHHKPV